MTLVMILLLFLVLFKYQKRYEVFEVCGKVEVRGFSNDYLLKKAGN